MAKLIPQPAATWDAPPRPVTWTGPLGVDSVPLPSPPFWLLPQASTVPFDLRARAWLMPAATWVIPLPAEIV
jgi:hypothetical protein